MNEIILQNKNGLVTANSRDVAINFGKEHGSVLKAIYGETRKNKHVNGLYDEILASGNPPTKYFIQSEYINRGKSYKECELTRDGFSLLVMGFTGREAVLWKLKYIDAFDKMEEKLKSGNYLSEEEKLKLQLFSKDSLEVVNAHNKLIELATAPLIADNERMKPKEEFHDAIAVAENCINFGEFAGTFQNNSNISFGRNKIMDWCRDEGYLCSSYNLKNKPSQHMLDSGYMKYKENINERNGKKYITYTPLLSGKGQIWLTKKLLEYFKEVA